MKANKYIETAGYKRALSALKKRAKFKLYPEYTNTDEANLKAAKLTTDDLDEVLETDFERFINYSVEKLKLPDDDDDDEYPEGEELDEDDKPTTLGDYGFDKGFLILNLIEFALARKDPKSLEAYFKKLRIPAAGKYAKTLNAIIKKA
jgi:hypothetical protein